MKNSYLRSYYTFSHLKRRDKRINGSKRRIVYRIFLQIPTPSPGLVPLERSQEVKIAQ